MAHAEALKREAIDQHEKRLYRSLQSSLAAIKEILETLGPLDPKYPKLVPLLEAVSDLLRQKIKDYVSQTQEQGLRKLRQDGLQKEKMEGFVNSLITLGHIAFELPTFKALVVEKMDELIKEACGGKRGVQNCWDLGQALMKYQDEHGNVDDGTMSKSAVAKKIVSEFPRFRNTQHMFKEQAMEATQKDPEASVKKMKAKSIVTDEEVPLDSKDLLRAWKSFQEHYDALLKRAFSGETQLDVAGMCKDKIAALRKDHNVDGEELDPVLIKESIPQFLGLFGYREYLRIDLLISHGPCREYC